MLLQERRGRALRSDGGESSARTVSLEDQAHGSLIPLPGSSPVPVKYLSGASVTGPRPGRTVIRNARRTG